MKNGKKDFFCMADTHVLFFMKYFFNCTLSLKTMRFGWKVVFKYVQNSNACVFPFKETQLIRFIRITGEKIVCPYRKRRLLKHEYEKFVLGIMKKNIIWPTYFLLLQWYEMVCNLIGT